MSRHKDLQPDPLTHTFRRPSGYRVGQVWNYTAQMTNDTGISADLLIWDNDGKQLFSGRVARSIARTALAVLEEEKRAETLDKPQRQMIMDIARTARKELEERLLVTLD